MGFPKTLDNLLKELGFRLEEYQWSLINHGRENNHNYSGILEGLRDRFYYLDNRYIPKEYQTHGKEEFLKRKTSNL